MLCQECRRRPATVKITTILENQKTELHLCEECARKRGELEFSSEGRYRSATCSRRLSTIKAFSSRRRPVTPARRPLRGAPTAA